MPEADVDVRNQVHDLRVMAGQQNPVPTLEPEPAVGRAADRCWGERWEKPTSRNGAEANGMT